MERAQFTFYRSFASALRRIRKDADRAKAYDAICDYALDGKEPDLSALPDAAAIAFELVKPNLDASKRKAESGKRGGNVRQEQTGSKPEANGKQTGSKPEANGKQTGSKPEANGKQGETSSEKENEIEKENECYNPLPPSLRESVKQWVKYKAERREAYKPTGLGKLITQIANAAEKYGVEAVADVIDRSMAANYQGIVFEKLEKGTAKPKTGGKNQVFVEHGGEMGDFERRAMQKMLERGLPDE